MEYYAILTSFSFKVYLRSFVIRTPDFDLMHSPRAKPLLSWLSYYLLYTLLKNFHLWKLSYMYVLFLVLMWICESEFNYWIFLLQTSSFNHAKKQALKPQMPQLILGVLGKFFELVYCRRLNNRFSYLLLEFSFSKLVKEGH